MFGRPSRFGYPTKLLWDRAECAESSNRIKCLNTASKLESWTLVLTNGSTAPTPAVSLDAHRIMMDQLSNRELPSDNRHSLLKRVVHQAHNHRHMLLFCCLLPLAAQQTLLLKL